MKISRQAKRDQVERPIAPSIAKAQLSAQENEEMRITELVGIGQPIVVGDANEIISMCFVPANIFGGGKRTVGLSGMCVEVALEPLARDNERVAHLIRHLCPSIL